MPDEKDLILRPPEDRPKKKRAPKPPPPPEDITPTVRLEQYFQESFAKRYGFPMGNVLYKIPRDRKILKTLISDVGEVEAAAMIHDFFFRFDKDRNIRFLTRAGNVPDFQRCLDRLVMLRNSAQGLSPSAPDHERTLENRSELAKLARPKGGKPNGSP